MNKNVVLTVIFISLTVLLVITAPGCSFEGTDKRAEKISQLKNKIIKITEGAFELPLPDEYPVIYSYLRDHSDMIENGPYFITIRYGLEKGALADIETYRKIEKSSGIRILYGPYGGTSPIELEYSPIFKNVTGFSGVEAFGSWKIDGKTVEYYYHVSDVDKLETISIFLSLDEGGAHVTYILSNKFTEADAKHFTALLLEELY